jgi:hypothetical protein
MLLKEWHIALSIDISGMDSCSLTNVSRDHEVEHGHEIATVPSVILRITMHEFLCATSDVCWTQRIPQLDSGRGPVVRSFFVGNKLSLSDLPGRAYCDAHTTW